MTFTIDWTGAPKEARMKPSALRRLELVFNRKVKKGKGQSVNVTFVTPKAMQTLNRVYRGKDAVTDVLSFRSDEGTPFPVDDPKLAGDIALCFSYIKRSAREQKVLLGEELVRMLVHGAMHCLGYDHMKPKDAVKMLPLQEKIIHAVST